MAAQILSAFENVDIHIFEQKPSVARKFLIAGRGGLNLTHSESLPEFTKKYGENAPRFEKYLSRFSPEKMIEWATSLGITLFKGSSGRMFPTGLKATPLLRAWLKVLDQPNIHFHLKHSWIKAGPDNNLLFNLPKNQQFDFKADAILYALGGASYPHLGATGAWTESFAAMGLDLDPLEPSNCGFHVNWSDHFLTRFEGTPIKNIRLSYTNHTIAGDLVVTKNGLEGGALYAHSKALRQELQQGSTVTVLLDLKPGSDDKALIEALSLPRGKMSLSNFLRKKLKLTPIQTSLLYEFGEKSDFQDTARFAAMIKRLPIELIGINTIEKAISSAGGLKFSNLDDHLMIKDLPGQFAAGEMLDWEAPTGGYLLQGSFATGVVAADGIADYLNLPQAKVNIS
jgi:uncharacterized flavoprotein (TIGR03862 family)